ncbi:hypothetical protein Y032_0017g3371 [Ancylostoma ceylanicum]|uniref:Uncharacterized protein n=1 Tax=Ancylostoma ceylanicum TaxID=53326 RepID=A0A016V5E4_9BILA|nr:hypothetical protein Y032_0017g3371 [Ancylostoma ceylanicum]
MWARDMFLICVRISGRYHDDVQRTIVNSVCDGWFHVWRQYSGGSAPVCDDSSVSNGLVKPSTVDLQ